jgi:outer membrane protein TolC
MDRRRYKMFRRTAIWTLLVWAAPVFLSGCLVVHPPCELPDDVEHCRTLAMAPMASDCPTGECRAPLSVEPPLLVDATPPPAWDLSLNDVIRMGLENSKVLRDLGGSVLRTPALAQTVHDPAIQATDPRFGMEGALAAFDAQVTSRLVAQHNDRAYNNLFLGGGTFLFQQDLDNFDTDVTKRTATGATFSLRHHVDYDANNALANRYPSTWNTWYEAYARQPLLQGAGSDFNRIAGPNGTPGLVNGVVIARINNAASTAEFEIALRDLVSNMENAYWDLYYAYRELDAKIAARDASLDTWRVIHANVQEGRGYSKLQEVQALEQYYRFQQDVIDALGGRNIDRTRTNNGSNGGTFRGVGGLHAAERRLRMWISIPINDGKLIRPSDEPSKVKVLYDWSGLATEALARRPELRRQRSQIQRAEMELVANRNFLLPQLDLIGRYRMRGFGQDWMGPVDPNNPYNNALANLTSGQFQEWELGFEYSMPLGFRRGYAAVRNAQLRVARERVILEDQERQVIHDLTGAYADTQRAYLMMELAYNRLNACQDQFRRAYDAFFELGGKVSLELVLDARIRLAEADTGYHRARVEYALALKNVHFEDGSLLEHNGAILADAPSWKADRAAIAQSNIVGDAAARMSYVMANSPRRAAEETAESAPTVLEESTTEAPPASEVAEDAADSAVRR